MHDHEFEKQVHQKMEGLRLHPSDAVWRRVEGQLHKKKRRRIIFWIPLLLAVLCTGAYILRHDLYTNTAIHINKSSLSSDDNKQVETVKTENAAKESSSAPSSALQQLQQGSGALVRSGNRKQAVAVNGTPGQSDKYIFHNRDRGIKKNKEADILLKQQVVAFSGPVTEEKQRFPLTETIPVQTGPLSSREPVAAIIPSVAYKHEPFSTLFVGPSSKEAALSTASLSPKKKLSWGVQATIIKTSLNNGSLGKLFSDVSFVDRTMAYQSPAANPNGGNLSISVPSAVMAGTGFSAGFFLRKETGSRWALSTGLNYTLYRTSIRIGSSRNISSSQFNSYRTDQYFLTSNGNDSRLYTNSYHFIGLPLLLQFQLSKGKLPIVWEGGMELARLVSSNALNYNSRLGGYYKDNRLLNHTEVYVLTGSNIKAFSNTRHPVNVGPQVQMGLSSLPAGSTGKKEHLTQYGFKIGTIIR